MFVGDAAFALRNSGGGTAAELAAESAALVPQPTVESAAEAGGHSAGVYGDGSAAAADAEEPRAKLARLRGDDDET